MTDKLKRQPGSNMDVGDLRRELDELKSFISGFLESIPGACFVLDREWRVVFLNDEAIRLFMSDEAFLVGKPLEDVYPRQLGRILSPRGLREILESKGRQTNRYSSYLQRWFRISVSASDFGVFVRMEDVTAEMLVNRLLRLNEFSVSESPDMIFWIKLGGHIIYANVAACNALGFSREELARMKMADIDPANDGAAWTALVQNLQAKGSLIYESRFRRIDRAFVPVEVVCKYLQYGDEDYLIASARDITERKQAEEELHEAKAQAELYVDLMGHDINNMNQTSLGFLELTLEDPALPAELKPALEHSRAAIENSSRLIHNVRQLQKIATEAREESYFDVREILEDVKASLEKVPGKRVEIRCDCPRACIVKANPLIRDIFINLIGNSIKHSGEQVEIDIKVLPAMVRGVASCEVTIEDNGPGLPDDTKAKLFEHTHEKRIRSKGLGLFIVKALVDRFHGTVRVEDRVPGDYTKGARFVVILPAAEQ